MDESTRVDPFRVGAWIVEPLNNQLRMSDDNVQVIRPKIMQVLLYLVEHQGETITRKQLIDKVWHGNEYVGEKGLTDAVWQLRKCLDEDPHYSPYIETIPKTGYRLLISSEELGDNSVASQKSALNSITSKNKLPWVISLLMLVIVSAFLINTFVKDKAVRDSPKEVKQLNQLRGFKSSPSISRDGRYISFAYDAAGLTEPPHKQFDLFIQELNKPGSEPVNITNAGRPVGFSDWSQDSTRIAYVMIEVDGQCKIKIMTLATRESREVTKCTAKYARGLSWSNNDRYLAYSDQIDVDKSPGIIIYDLETGNKRQVTFATKDQFSLDVDATWSRNDDYLVFIRTKGVDNNDLYKVDLQGNETQVTNIQSSINSFTLGKNDDEFYYSLSADNLDKLWQVNSVTGKAVKLNLNENTVIYPTYSAKSNTLAFVRRSLLTNIVALSLDSEKAFDRERAIATNISIDTYPSYAQTSNQIAFISNRSGKNQFWLTDSKQSNIKQLTELNTQIYGTAMSPDGTKVAFTSSTEKSRLKQIHILEVETGSIKQLSKNLTDHAPPTWSKDGQFIFTGESNKSKFYMWKYDLKGNKEKLFEQTGVYGFPYGENQFYYTKIDKGGIWVYDFDTQQERLLIDALRLGDGSNWSLTDKGIYYTVRTVSNDDIYFHNFSDGSNTLVYRYPWLTIAKYQNFVYLAKSHELLLVKRLQPNSNIFYTQYP